MKPSDLKIHVSGPKPDSFPIAEFLRLCERVSKGELDGLNRESRWVIANVLVAATDHITEQLGDEAQREMMQMPERRCAMCPTAVPLSAGPGALCPDCRNQQQAESYA